MACAYPKVRQVQYEIIKKCRRLAEIFIRTCFVQGGIDKLSTQLTVASLPSIFVSPTGIRKRLDYFLAAVVR